MENDRITYKVLAYFGINHYRKSTSNLNNLSKKANQLSGSQPHGS